ncbi:hypothetical protein RHDC4_00537 [Rhodocyclaceae bacterium]|nr:hypothetical protein RHDC4_00537 [Rhodocyclaceae bacterium]
MKNILVWDLPVRIGHWLMVAGFALAWLTGDSEEWRLVHVAAGSTVAAVALFRLLWGFVGTHHARFAAFVRPPADAVAYVVDLLRFKPWHHAGHNPAGAFAILALLGLALLTAGAGWLTYEEIGGDMFEDLHEGLAAGMLTVVGVHLAGVAAGSLMHGENLVRAMLTGRKQGAEEEAIAGARPLAAALLLAWVGTAVWFVAGAS